MQCVQFLANSRYFKVFIKELPFILFEGSGSAITEKSCEKWYSYRSERILSAHLRVCAMFSIMLPGFMSPKFGFLFALAFLALFLSAWNRLNPGEINRFVGNKSSCSKENPLRRPLSTRRIATAGIRSDIYSAEYISSKMHRETIVGIILVKLNNISRFI